MHNCIVVKTIMLWKMDLLLTVYPKWVVEWNRFLNAFLCWFFGLLCSDFIFLWHFWGYTLIISCLVYLVNICHMSCCVQVSIVHNINSYEHKYILWWRNLLCLKATMRNNCHLVESLWINNNDYWVLVALIGSLPCLKPLRGLHASQWVSDIYYFTHHCLAGHCTLLISISRKTKRLRIAGTTGESTIQIHEHQMMAHQIKIIKNPGQIQDIRSNKWVTSLWWVSHVKKIGF